MNLKQLVLKYKKKTVILILLIIAAAGADIYAGYTLAWYYDIVTASDLQGAGRFSVYDFNQSIFCYHGILCRSL